MKACVLKNLKNLQPKVIVYSNEKDDANKNAVNSTENMMEANNIDGDVLSVNGSTNLPQHTTTLMRRHRMNPISAERSVSM